jgi:hypothetical protein
LARPFLAPVAVYNDAPAALMPEFGAHTGAVKGAGCSNREMLFASWAVVLDRARKRRSGGSIEIGDRMPIPSRRSSEERSHGYRRCWRQNARAPGFCGGTIVIERVSAGNAFTEAMVRQLGEIIRRAAEEADIVTLSGAGADFTIGRDRGERLAIRCTPQHQRAQ